MRNPANKCWGEKWGEAEKLHCFTLYSPGHLKTIRPNQILDHITWKKCKGKNLHQKGTGKDWVGWMTERVSEYFQCHTRKRDMAKETGEWEKDCRENKSSFPWGIDCHLYRELAFSTKATSILSKVGLFRERSLFLVYIELTPQPCPWARPLCLHLSFFHNSFFLYWFLECGFCMHVQTNVNGTNVSTWMGIAIKSI